MVDGVWCVGAAWLAGRRRSNSILFWNELLEVHRTSGFHVSAVVWGVGNLTRRIDPPSVGRVAGGQAFWLVGGGGRKRVRVKLKRSGGPVDNPSVRWAHGECGLWVECHTEEFCVKVLKFEIMNSRKSFNYFSRVVP